LFNHLNIKLTNKHYVAYKETLKTIIGIYYKIFSENTEVPSVETIHEIALKYKTIFEIIHSRELGISDRYSLTVDIVNQIETGISDIETLIRSTKRDINA
jgi:hypothetical protein